jgi:two-component system, OmpR family, phosphate regulon sensor histidine kinase PhoR
MRNTSKGTFLAYALFVLVAMLLLGFLLVQVTTKYVNMAVEQSLLEESLSLLTKNIWLLVGLAFCLMLIPIFMISYQVFEKYIKPIRSVTKVSQKLAKGQYNARTYETYYGESANLSSAINLLARNLQEMQIHNETQNDRLKAVIDNMNSGLMLVNEKGYIQLINRAFLEQFNGEISKYIGFLYYEVLPYEEVHDIVKDVFMVEEHVERTVVVSTGIERQFFSISGAPIFNHGNSLKGAVLVFHNITELKKLEEMRKDFVANVSHELKTPITSIRGFTETLLDGAMEDPAALQQFLSIINKESSRMQHLIEDLLQLSKLEKADLQLFSEKIKIEELVDGVISIVRHSLDEKDIELEVYIEPYLFIYADQARMIQLLINLVTNAIRYTPRKGKVTIQATNVDSEEVKISVADTGIGIPSEELPRVFERFYRVDKARSRDSGGTGLGLAIVKHIVEAHQGRITVDSEVNKGTRFNVYLKIKK